jgi:hypothetical protein
MAALVLATLVFPWPAVASSRTFASESSLAPEGLDPAQAAADVFQNSDFWWKRIERRTVPTSWLESILRAVWDMLRQILGVIGDLIRRILQALFGAFTGVSSGGAVVVWLIVVALLGWSLWKLVPEIVRWLTAGAAAPSTSEPVSWQKLAEASELFAKAGQAFRDGLYAEAIRLALLALIAQLEQDGLLRYDTARTNREYLRELRDSSELAARFGRLARIYERVWYGRLSAHSAEAEQALRLCGSVINREELAPE